MFEQGRVLESQVSSLAISEIQYDMGPQLNYSCARSDRGFPDFPAIWSSGRERRCFRKLLGALPCYLLFAGKLRTIATRNPHD